MTKMGTALIYPQMCSARYSIYMLFQPDGRQYTTLLLILNTKETYKASVLVTYTTAFGQKDLMQLSLIKNILCTRQSDLLQSY